MYVIFIVLIIYSIIFKYCKCISDLNPIDNFHIPKIIWTHWDNIETAPLVIKNIIELRMNKFQDWQINVVNNLNINLFIDEKLYPENYNTLISAHKSDWIRLYLLKTYGGVWLDAGIIVNDLSEFNKMYDNSISKNSELTAFYLDGSTNNNDPTTFIENWFIMAPINSRIINAWFNEFEYAINIGFLNYKNELFNKDINIRNVYMFGENDIYLTCHAAIQKIIQLKEISEPNILLYRAEDNMYKLHIDCEWDKDCIYKKVSTEKLTHIPYIKLRGPDRGDGNFIIIN